MNEQQIRQLIQQEIQGHASSARFGLNSIPRHIHNNLDSPYVFQPILIYIGSIDGTGGVNLLPNGWTLAGGVGVYTVTHNLGSDALYVVTASASADFGSGFDVVNISNPNGTSVTFQVFNPSTLSLSVCNFFFSLTVINNRSQQLPTYYGNMLS